MTQAYKHLSVFTGTPHLSTDTDSSTNVTANVCAARHIFLLAYLHKASSTAFTLTRWKIIRLYSPGRSLRSSELLVSLSCQLLPALSLRNVWGRRKGTLANYCRPKSAHKPIGRLLAELQQVSRSVETGLRIAKKDHSLLLSVSGKQNLILLMVNNNKRHYIPCFVEICHLITDVWVKYGSISRPLAR